MSVYLHSIETRVPTYSRTQDEIVEFMEARTDSERSKRVMRKIYRSSGIGKRHTVLPDFTPGSQPYLLTDGDENPRTGARNKIFAQEAPKLIIPAAQHAINSAEGINSEDITHVITVSCTGFYNPGPDYQLIRSLNLNPKTQRYNLGFMGCYAAFPAMKMAKQFCQADPDAVVLVVCLELCTVHFDFSDNMDAILSNSLFADGAAATIISARKPANGKKVLKLGELNSTLIPGTEDQMAWEVGDFGFDIRLSTYVPKILEANVPQEIGRLLENLNASPDGIETWAIHPGGQSIVNKLESAMSLQPHQIQSARKVLFEYGNMSSATILFVLRDIMLDGTGTSVMAMAFGPGLTMESALLERVTIPANPKTKQTTPSADAVLVKA